MHLPEHKKQRAPETGNALIKNYLSSYELLFYDSANRAVRSASAALSANSCIDVVLCITLRDSAYGATISA